MTGDSHATKGTGMGGEVGGGAARLPVSGRCPWGNFRRPLVLVGRHQPPTQTSVCCSGSLPEVRWGRARFASRTATGSALAPSQGHVSVTQRPLSVVTASHRPLTAPPPPPGPVAGARVPSGGWRNPPLLSVAQTSPALPGDAQAKRVGAPSAEEATQCPPGRSPRGALGWRSAAAGSAL